LTIGSGIWSSVSWDISSIEFLLCRKVSGIERIGDFAARRLGQE
jgi:hypothetical protein